MRLSTWFGKQAPCPLEEARRRHLRLLKTAMTDTQGEDVGLVKQLLDRLLTLVWDLPGDWQMFRGTLDMYTRALERGYEDKSRVHRRERGEHSALLMAAAFWCCQTLPQYEIEAEDSKTGEIHVWSYEMQRFFDWLRKWGDHERLPAYEAKAAEGTRLTPAQRMWFATWLVPSGFVHQAGRVHGGGFWAFVLADEPTTDLHRRLDLLPTPAPPRGGTQPHQEVGSDDEMPSDALVRSFLRTIATALRDGTVRVNTPQAPAFADAERTFLVYPKAVTLCFGATYKPQVVLDHLVAAGLSGGLEQVRLTPEGRDRAAVLYGFYLRSADLEYVPEVIFEGTIEGVA